MMAKLKILTGRIPDPEKLPLPSLGLNKSLGGGLMGGRIHVFWGPRSSTKTTQALFLIAEAQQRGKVCLYVDAEKTYNSSWAEKCGVNIDALRVIRANSVEDILETVIPFMEREEIDVLVIDSLSSIGYDAFFDSPDYKGMGVGARSMNMLTHKLLRFIGNDTQVVLIAHGNMAAVGQSMGYKAKLSKSVEHWASTILQFRQGNSKDKDVRGDGAKQIYWSVEKSKQSMYPDGGSYWFLVTPTSVEIDQIAELARLAIDKELVEKRGGWFYLDDQTKFHGENNLIQALRDDKELQASFRKGLEID